MAKVCTETLLKDRGPLMAPSDSLYRVFTLTSKAYTETPEAEVLLTTPFDSLYQVFTLTVNVTETPLKD